jgi:hypothetical protein
MINLALTPRHGATIRALLPPERTVACRYWFAADPANGEPRCPDCAGEARAATTASVRLRTFSFLMMLCTRAFTVLNDMPSR